LLTRIRSTTSTQRSTAIEFQAVIFDLDGTLLDTLEDLADSTNAALERLGFSPHPTDSYRYFVGEGRDVLAERALPPAGRNQANVTAVATAITEEYRRRWAGKTAPYPEIPSTLDKLQELGLRMAVLSNKPHDFVKLTVDRFLSRWSFDVVLGHKPEMPRKPDPAGALHIAELFGMAPARFVYVGDTNVDMFTANSAGMFAVGALWGFRNEDELQDSGAKVVIEKPADLLDIFRP